jgi:primosomal protein N' (replication factor Y)
MFVYSVLLPLPFDPCFDYHAAEGFAVGIGDYVRVPFGSQEIYGVVWEIKTASATVEPSLSDSSEAVESPLFTLQAEENSSHSRKKKPKKPLQLKTIAAKAEHLPPMTAAMREVIEWVARYTLAPRGMVLKMALSIPDALHPPATATHYTLTESEQVMDAKVTAARQKIMTLLQDGFARTATEIASEAGVAVTTVRAMADAGFLQSHEIATGSGVTAYQSQEHPPLSALQQAAAQELIAALKAGFSVTVLDGVTGSGKTEVYFEVIEQLLVGQAQDGENTPQILVLLPEIALSVQWIKRFSERFGDVPHLWHSGVSFARKRETWRAIATGKARLVVGARSALFLPFQNLQLIVIDEEHEQSYKQEEGVMYQARDVAVVRAQKEQIPVVLVSATPSLESVVNTEQGKYHLLHLPQRYGAASLPDVELVDMRKHRPSGEKWVSVPLQNAIKTALDAGNQAMLFINRRGFAPLILCRACGHRFGCPHCSTWLVEHKHPPRLQCHQCDYRTPPPSHCIECGAAAEDSLQSCGPGVERVAQEAALLFPEAKIGLMTSDSIPTPEAAERLIQQVMTGEINLLIGTQMMAKGYHFPALAVVGGIDADAGLAGGDLRASERSWQLLHQLAGRAGREEAVRGKVLLQTYNPEHAVMQALLHYDRENFIAAEKQGREDAGMPPFGRLAAIILEGANEQEVITTARLMVKALPSYRGIQLFGPAPAPLAILRGKYRYRLLLKTLREVNLSRLVREWVTPLTFPKTVRVKIDIDPYSFL